MLLDLGLPSFDTIMHNCKMQFLDSINKLNKQLVASTQYISSYCSILQCMWCVLCTFVYSLSQLCCLK